MVIQKILASPSLWWDAHPSTPFDWEFLSLSRMRGSFLPSYQHPQYLPLRTVWCSSWVFLLPCLGSALGYFYMRERFGDFVLAWFFGFVFVFFLFSPPQLPSQGLPAKAGERHSGLPPAPAPAPLQGCPLSPSEPQAQPGPCHLEDPGADTKRGEPTGTAPLAVSTLKARRKEISLKQGQWSPETQHWVVNTELVAFG